MRLLAAELGSMGIRVNAENPDAVIRDSKIFAGEWGDDRAATYGVEREKLGEVSGELGKTTGAVIPVDSGVPAAFMR
jgi:NAD(P)-dependent dehydrogenase (short-subunit alcohol dehydrogenase family)